MLCGDADLPYRRCVACGDIPGSPGDSICSKSWVTLVPNKFRGEEEMKQNLEPTSWQQGWGNTQAQNSTVGVS